MDIMSNVNKKKAVIVGGLLLVHSASNYVRLISEDEQVKEAASFAECFSHFYVFQVFFDNLIDFVLIGILGEIIASSAYLGKKLLYSEYSDFIERKIDNINQLVAENYNKLYAKLPSQLQGLAETRLVKEFDQVVNIPARSLIKCTIVGVMLYYAQSAPVVGTFFTKLYDSSAALPKLIMENMSYADIGDNIEFANIYALGDTKVAQLYRDQFLEAWGVITIPFHVVLAVEPSWRALKASNRQEALHPIVNYIIDKAASVTILTNNAISSMADKIMPKNKERV